MTLEQKLAIFAGVVPGAFTLVAMLVAWRLFSRADRGSGPFWAGPVLAAVALVLGDYSKFGTPVLWPDDNTYRFPHAVGVVALAGVMEALVRLPAWAAVVLRTLAYAAAYWMLTEGYHPQVLDTPAFVALGVAGAGGAALVAHAADHGAAALPGWRGPALFALLFAPLAPLTFLGGLSYGMHAGVAMIAFTVASAIAALLAPRLTFARGTATVLTGVVFAVALGAGVQSEPVSIPALVIFVAAPAAIGVAALVPARRRGARLWLTGVCLMFLLSLALGQMGAARAALDASQQDDPYEGLYGVAPPPASPAGDPPRSVNS